jgi:hypothetical protein
MRAIARVRFVLDSKTLRIDSASPTPHVKQRERMFLGHARDESGKGHAITAARVSAAGGRARHSLGSLEAGFRTSGIGPVPGKA